LKCFTTANSSELERPTCKLKWLDSSSVGHVFDNFKGPLAANVKIDISLPVTLTVSAIELNTE
jgi:hypothetical protein